MAGTMATATATSDPRLRDAPAAVMPPRSSRASIGSATRCCTGSTSSRAWPPSRPRGSASRRPSASRRLRERVLALEAAQARLQSELRRREQEWHDAVQQLEDDRRLLTEAWERLEHERVDAPAPPQAAGPRDTVSRVEHATAAVHRQPDPLAGDDSVTREILRQFQALRGDVRRTANGAGRGGGGG